MRMRPSDRYSRGRYTYWFGYALLLGMILAPIPSLCQDNSSIPAAQIPSLLSAVRNVHHLTFGNEPVPLDNQEIRERFEKELLLTLWNRPQVILWIKRSARYFPLIEKMLKEADLPDDLKYVAVVESALRPHIRSSKGAVGYWQFIKPTGLKYDLRIDRDIDERRNLFAATRAAIAYFKDLYDIFGTWALSAAGYNMGEQGLQAEVLIQQIDDYYRLYLPLETQRYLFRILTAKLILEAPRAYGFFVTETDLYPPLDADRISISRTEEIPVQTLAQAADTSFKTIKDLNPQIRGHYLAPGSHTLLIPNGMAKGFESRLEKRMAQLTSTNRNRVYIVQTGDTLTGIAEQFNVPLTALLIWNRLDYRKSIHPGDRLMIHP
ncbi:MAG: transglycosylase SLT domain-containing protein [Thermodesulfobacteriota bacterium]|nr:transglycosylase SLT domain-containing protein [Thermodesulfobacteriota bacterium]